MIANYLWISLNDRSTFWRSSSAWSRSCRTRSRSISMRTESRSFSCKRSKGQLSSVFDAVLRIRIRDPVPFWPICPGSGMGRKPVSGSGIRDEQPGSYFLEFRNHFFGLQYSNSLLRIRDEKNSDPGFGTEKFGIHIPDPQHCKNSKAITWMTCAMVFSNSLMRRLISLLLLSIRASSFIRACSKQWSWTQDDDR